MIQKVNIIGSGNVSTHLARYLNVYVDILSVYSKNFMNARKLADEFNATPVDDAHELSDDADLNIICLKDDAIELIAAGMNKSIPVVHTSGSVSIDVFSQFDTYGILYPLQSFSKSRAVEISKIPFFLETSSDEFYQELGSFCDEYLSTNTQPADSKKRAGMHLAAVIANNFSNYLLSVSEAILNDYDLPLETIEPLMEETINKAFLNGPVQSQTGPARRSDQNTVNKHLSLLKDEDQKKLYQMMSELIEKRFKA